MEMEKMTMFHLKETREVKGWTIMVNYLTIRMARTMQSRLNRLFLLLPRLVDRGGGQLEPPCQTLRQWLASDHDSKTRSPLLFPSL